MSFISFMVILTFIILFVAFAIMGMLLFSYKHIAYIALWIVAVMFSISLLVLVTNIFDYNKLQEYNNNVEALIECDTLPDNLVEYVNDYNAKLYYAHGRLPESQKKQRLIFYYQDEIDNVNSMKYYHVGADTIKSFNTTKGFLRYIAKNDIQLFQKITGISTK